MPRCRGCNEPILWAITMNGKRMPLNPDPDPAGNVRLTGHMVRTERGEAPQCVVESGPSLLGEDRYMPHHATCSEVEQFR